MNIFEFQGNLCWESRILLIDCYVITFTHVQLNRKTSCKSDVSLITACIPSQNALFVPLLSENNNCL